MDEIKRRMPISQYLEQHGYNLIPAGPNRMKMLCPLPEHNEKTPSCAVPPPDGIQICHCFGCGQSFDLFTFVEKMEGMPFMDAVEMFAEQLHIQYKSLERDPDETPRRVMREILKVTARGLNKLYDALDADHAAKRNVSARGIPVDNASNHNLFGWAPEDDSKIVNALLKKGFTEKQLIDSGVARKWDNGTIHFPWHGRLMFVIRDITGNPVGFTGRIIYDSDKSKGKYVNSVDNPIFHKSSILFCEDIARKKAYDDKEIFVVEGQFDVIACQHAGFDNTVASSGTAFTNEHANLLRRLVTPNGRIVFMFDADEPGQNAALKAFKATPAIQSQSYATVTIGDKDASDMYRDDPESLKKQLKTTRPLYHHIIDWLASKHNLKEEGERRVFINECMDAYNTIIDPILKENFLTYVSLKSGVDASSLGISASKMKGNAIASNVGNANIDIAKDDEAFISGNSDDLQPEDYALALAIEQPELRPRLKGLPMNRKYRIIQERIADNDLTMSDAVQARLQTATEMMRQFEGYAPLVDVDGLFDAQVEIIKLKAKNSRLSEFHAEHMPSITNRTTPANMRAYANSLARIMGEDDGEKSQEH